MLAWMYTCSTSRAPHNQKQGITMAHAKLPERPDEIISTRHLWQCTKKQLIHLILALLVEMKDPMEKIVGRQAIANELGVHVQTIANWSSLLVAHGTVWFEFTGKGRAMCTYRFLLRDFIYFRNHLVNEKINKKYLKRGKYVRKKTINKNESN